MNQYNDSILFEAFRIMKQVFRILVYAMLIFGIALCNDFGWIVGIGYNGYVSRTSDEDLNDNNPLWAKIHVNFGSGHRINGGDFTDYTIDRTQFVGDHLIAIDLCDVPYDLGGYQESFDSLLDHNFYTRSGNYRSRKVARINHAVVTAAVSAIRLRAVIARLEEGKSAGVNEDESHYCGAGDSIFGNRGMNHRLSDPVAWTVKLNHAPKVILRDGTACLESYEWSCENKPTFYADLFTVTLPPEQEEAEAAMLQMGTEDFWLTAAHENGVHKDSEIRASVAALHRILNERHPQFDEGGIRDTRGPSFLQIIGLQNFDDHYNSTK